MKRIGALLFFVYSFSLNAQTITTFAGKGICVSSGDGEAASTADIMAPAGGVFDIKGNFYFPERLSNKIRRISSSGIITTVAGNGSSGFSGDNGAATAAELNNPVWVVVDKIGNIYFPDINNNRIREVDTAGIIHTIAGNGSSSFSGDGGAATIAALANPLSVCVDDSGNVYELEATRLRKINRVGIINTIAGDGTEAFSGDGGPANLAEIHAGEIYIDSKNNIYISDIGNYRVRKIDAVTGIINTIAGNGSPGFGGDNGPATLAKVEPFTVALDAFGNLFIADGNQRIRKINKDGIITTFAGTGVMGFSGDGGSATDAQIYNPEGVAIDSCGNVYFSDCANCRIREISFPHCNYLSVANATVKNDLLIYPNPTYDILNIDNLTMQFSYRLLNIIGQAAQQGALKAGSNSISVQSLPPGVYMLEISDEEGEKTVRKIVKQ